MRDYSATLDYEQSNQAYYRDLGQQQQVTPSLRQMRQGANDYESALVEAPLHYENEAANYANL